MHLAREKCHDVNAKITAEVMRGEKKATVAERYEISLSSLSTILNLKDSITSAVSPGGSGQKRKKLKEMAYVDAEKALYSWLLDMCAKNMPLGGAILQQKALNFANILECNDLKASSSWLQRVKERYGIVGKVVSGESAEANVIGAEVWLRDRVPDILARYDVSNIFVRL